MPHDVALIATHIAPSSGFGGVAESAAGLARAWRDQGRSFAVAASDGSCGPAVTESALGMPPGMMVRLYRARWAVRWGFGAGAPAALWAVCRAAAAVYVCGIATWPVTLAPLVCRLLGRPYVVAPRGGLLPDHVALIRRHKPHKWLYYRWFVLPALRHARAIHATSALERDGILEALPGARVAVVPNGVDVAFWCSPHPGPRPTAGTRFCYVGRLSREKGIRRFLDLWLRDRQPGDRLTIVGEGIGAYAESVRCLARSAGAAVELAGRLDRAGVRRVMADSDFLVLPSGIEASDMRENFGNAVAEALAVGRPVLATRGLAWDHLPACGAGILFDADDGAILAAIAQARSRNAADYAAMATAARHHASTHLALNLTATVLWTLISPP